MSKSKSHYVCSNCGTILLKWSGHCLDCNSWGTIYEEVLNADTISHKGKKLSIEKLDLDVEDYKRTSTNIGELDLVLGGGMVEGSAILVGGDPGIGKSTLLLQLGSILAKNCLNCLYVTGEESARQIKLRASRLGVINADLNILAATNLSDIISTIESMNNLDVIIIDSIQTIYSENISSAPGTVSQVKYVSGELVNYVKKNNISLFLVGHVTKEGQIAGPKVLEHMVDTVLYFEGENNLQYRILRSVKNRFGGANEIGIFEMTSSGLKEVLNPSELFLLERGREMNGTSVFASIEGSRPILVEVQALVAKSNMPTPRRSVVGWDLNRLSMILAVLGVRYGLKLDFHEVYLSIAGGIKVTDPGADLAVAAALISAATNKPLSLGSVFFGEVGLSGEVRRVGQSEARIKESLKLGFDKVLCPEGTASKNSKITPVTHIKQLGGIFNL